MDDDLQIDSDEDLFRNPVYYEPAGRNLDLDRPDLGVPHGQDLLNVLLRMRGRVPRRKARAHLPRLPGSPSDPALPLRLRSARKPSRTEGLPEHFSCRRKHEA